MLSPSYHERRSKTKREFPTRRPDVVIFEWPDRSNQLGSILSTNPSYFLKVGYLYEKYFYYVGCPRDMPRDAIGKREKERVAEYPLAVCSAMEHIPACHEVENLVDKANGGTHTSGLCPEEERLPPERQSCCDERKECSLSKHSHL